MSITPDTRDLPAVVTRGRRHHLVPYVVAGLVLAMATGAYVGFQLGDEDPSPQPSASAPATTSPTTSPAPSPTPSPTTAPPPVDRATVVWPFGGTRYTDPVAVTRAFATTYLRFAAPVVGAFQQGDTRSGEVEVRPLSNGPVTTVMVRQVGADDSWYVIGAATANIEVTEPDAGDLVRSPLRITGRALAFEGTVQVEIRQDGELGVLGSGFVTGGGSEMSPFTGTIAFRQPAQRYGVIVLYTESAENGQVWSAAVLRIRLG